MTQDKTFGGLIHELRRTRDLSQEELARRAGCATITVRKIEADDLRPSVQIAERLAIALGIPLEERATFIRLARDERTFLIESAPIPVPTNEEIGAEDLSGHAIRGYALAELIGHGGMGVVYRAVQPLVEREVAVKIILPSFANNPDFIRRFEAEAQLIARLEHPHIVPLYDYWREPNAAYLVMRLLRGGSGQDLLQGGGLALDQVLRLAEQIGAALEAAHRVGIIHRDLKPANILFDEDGNAYLADFGIAKNLSNPNLQDVTQADAIVGSPNYMSPEQIRSELVRPQTDIYCFGVMLYELLTGTIPFQGPTPIQVMHQHLTEPLPPLASNRVGLPKMLDEVIAQATAKDPLERYADLNGLLADLRQAIHSPGKGKHGATTISHAPTLETRLITEADNPYKGLRAFAESDRHDFFGRDSLIQQLLLRLGESGDLSRFLAVIGPSGSGKSSVVKAGLFPALRRGALPGSDNWFIVEMVPGVEPLEELEAALLRVAVNPPESLISQLRQDKRGLLRAVLRCLPYDPTIEIVLVIDQFEEVFTLVTDETARAHFLDLLMTAALDERSRMRIVLTLRADFVDRPLGYVDFGELLRQRMEVVLPLTPDELEQAIIKPAERAGLELEPGLVPIILNDLGNQPGTLPLLQYALTELFERREGTLLTKSAYQAIGGVLGALGRKAEDVYANLDEPGRNVARQVFLRLVRLGEGAEDTRRRVPRLELESLLDQSGSQKLSISSVIELFSRSRLLALDRDPGTRGPTVEVAHEALIREWPRLRDWLLESRSDVRLERILAGEVSEWLAANRDTSFLLTGARLEQYEGWALITSLALTTDEHDFINSSLAQRERQHIDERERQQRELAAALKLAETEKARADEQTRNVVRVRARNWVIALAGAAAFALAILAGLFGLQSSQNAGRAQQNAETANQAAQTAEVAREVADAAREAADAQRSIALGAQATTEAESHIRATAEAEAQQTAKLAFSRELAGQALVNLEVDPERSILLALEGLKISDTREAEEALHQAVLKSRVRLRLTGHTDSVNDIAYSLDGKLIASGGVDGKILLWNAETGEQIATLLQSEIQNGSVDFSPDSKQLLSMNVNGTLELIDLQTKKVVASRMAYPPSDQYLVPVAVFSPDGKFWAVSGANLTIWDAATQQPLYELKPPFDCECVVDYAAFSGDGQRLAAAFHDANFLVSGVVVFEVATQRALLTVPVKASRLAVSPNGKVLAVDADVDDAYDPTVWNIETGEKLFNINYNELGSVIYEFAFSPDSQRLGIVASLNGIWDVNTGQRLMSLPGGLGEEYTLAFNPTCTGSEAFFVGCGFQVATGGRDGSIKVWDTSPSGNQEVLHLPAGSLSPDGRNFTALALTSTSSEAQIIAVRNWQLAGFNFPSDAPLVPTDYQASSFTPPSADSLAYLDGFHGLFTGQNFSNGLLHIWNFDKPGALNPWELCCYSGNLGFLEVSPNGHQLAVGFFDGTTIVWDLETREIDYKVEQPFNEFTDQLVVPTWSPDGRLLATASMDTVVLRDAVTGAELKTLHGSTDIIWSVMFSPDSQRLVVGDRQATAIIWNVASGEQLLTLTGHTTAVNQAVFSPDGQQILTVSDDGTTRLWDALTGRELLSIPTGRANKVMFSPDGTQAFVNVTNEGPQIITLKLDDLVKLAKSRVTRRLTTAECQRYLHVAECQ